MWLLRIDELAFLRVEAHLHWCFILLPIFAIPEHSLNTLGGVDSLWYSAACVVLFLRQTPSCKMCASHSSDGSDEEDSEQPNMWNVMLELFTLWEISPRLQQALEDWEMCRVALTCHFALDVFCVVVYSG